jgi:hypothetical protein
MRVIVETEVFAASKNRGFSLPSLFYLGLRQRHRIQAIDEQAPPFQDWLSGLSTSQQEDCRLVLDDGLLTDASAPKGQTILIRAIETSVWSASPPQLSLDDALIFLQKPFRVLLENSGNDRAFLLTFATSESRKLLQDWERKEWLRVESGGGILEVERQVRLAIQTPGEHLRLWVMFDSDALRSGAPSKQSKELARACSKKISYHQLGRRAIENYLPLETLSRWVEAKQEAEAKKSRRKLLRAFQQMTSEQRYYYNMKGGLGRDTNRDDIENAKDLYTGLNEDTQNALESGFGGSIAELYQQNLDALNQKKEPIIKTEWLDADGSTEEMNAALQQLLEKMR